MRFASITGRSGGTLSAALVAAALVATPLCAAATPSQTEIAVCPNVTQTTYPEAGVGGIGPATFGCEAAAHSAGFVFVQPDGTCTTPTNTSLGTFVTTQKPLGMWISVGSPNSCATNPPTLGFGAVGGRVTVNAAQAGFCPTSLTIPAVIGDHAAVVFPIGNLPLGSYSVTATFLDQAVLNPMTQLSLSWIGSQATGTLRVGSTFKETDAEALVTTGKSEIFAVTLRNSVAGPGAGELVSTRTGDPSEATLQGTEYYACGTIGIAATVRFGKRGTRGIVRLTGAGSLTGGTGNYRGIKGNFKLRGLYNTKTKRGTFTLTGDAGF
jgi:hypothetical protein